MYQLEVWPPKFSSCKIKCAARQNIAPHLTYFSGLNCRGRGAIPTSMQLEFLNTSSEDSYTFTLIDDVSNISKTIDNISVDLTNQFSKDSFG